MYELRKTRARVVGDLSLASEHVTKPIFAAYTIHSLVDPQVAKRDEVMRNPSSAEAKFLVLLVLQFP